MNPNLLPWRRLLWIGRLEATTFAVLVLVAVPAKYLLGAPALTRLLGPIHGMVFLIYAWMAIEAAASTVDEPNFERLRLWRVLLYGVLPFGPLLIEREVRRRLLAAPVRTDG